MTRNIATLALIGALLGGSTAFAATAPAKASAKPTTAQKVKHKIAKTVKPKSPKNANTKLPPKK